MAVWHSLFFNMYHPIMRFIIWRHKLYVKQICKNEKRERCDLGINDSKLFGCHDEIKRTRCELHGGQNENGSTESITSSRCPLGLTRSTSKNMTGHIVCVLDRTVGHISICWDYLSTFL